MSRQPEISVMVQGLLATGNALDGRLHQALLQIEQSMRETQRRLAALESAQAAIASGLAGAGVYVRYRFLTADYALPFPSEPAGSLFFYLFRQDDTGGWAVTLPSGFAGFFPDQISLAAGRFSAFIGFKLDPTTVVPAAFGIEGIIT